MGDRSKIGGILSIVAGAFGIIIGFLFALGIFVFRAFFRQPAYYTPYGTPPVDVFTIMAIIYGVIALFFVLLGALAIVGGIFALKRKHWGWALAGAIAGAITFFPCGIAATIFVSLGKPEFSAPSGAPAPPPPTVNESPPAHLG